MRKNRIDYNKLLYHIYVFERNVICKLNTVLHTVNAKCIHTEKIFFFLILF